MAKINVDLTAIKIRELLNHQKTDEAKALAREALASGRAKPETMALAAQLWGKGKGRPASGPYKWIEIGQANYWLEAEGVPPRQRMLRLLQEFPDRGEKHIERCITMYRKATEND
ncbi:hypothetical protein BMJ27_07425 [Sinorhizobium medicae]|uniref:hypothetical protein n=1 Tax=Sinorhizobium medicae TaxID=110321 RepID=UPI000C7DADBE|nr:hypothetical protein [Sinorhizobium medicae]PLU37984.1 hypothetical protein BMJ27_07425 [Sinorhizobium medicae]